MNLIEWLKEAPEFPKFYFRSREGDIERAAYGKKEGGSTLYGGMAFFPDLEPKDSVWNDFPRNAFWNPKKEKLQKIASLSLSANDPISAEETSLPSEQNWIALIEQSLKNIQKGNLEKVVLARRTTLEVKVDPYLLLQQLQSKSTGAALFAVQFSPQSVFIGATPERLFRRSGKQIWVDALAGTRPLGVEGLLENPKELREFTFVKRSIETAIAPLCKEWKWDGKDRIHKTARVQHLYNCFVGTLDEDVNDQDILLALHPTAALGGMPRQESLKYIAKHEPFERGWYAAPLGFSNKEEAEFVVGIRSALVESDRIHLFAGTGIVEGSNPQREWDELNQKISLIKDLL